MLHKNELKIQFPFSLTARDYHDFEYVLSTLKEITREKNIFFEEITGTGTDPEYLAVFYTNLKTAASLIKQLKAERDASD
jgi:polyphosphate kinase